MRRIGSITNEKDARTFGDYLYASGIENRIEPSEAPDEQNRQWDVWIYAENQLDQAKALLAEFLAAPDDPKFNGKQRPLGGTSLIAASSSHALSMPIRQFSMNSIFPYKQKSPEIWRSWNAGYTMPIDGGKSEKGRGDREDDKK